ncbi:MAG: reverse transcriptase domain-containing protein [Gemmatimonadaceae bacterium]|nr:reverse transcriptase domain-containing protein [Gemmatimonadaceae bacterium]
MPHELTALLSRADVANLLGVPLSKLTWWIWALDEDRRYDEFEIRRRSGGDPRTIRSPIQPIKAMQSRLAGVLTDAYVPRGHVHGFVPQRSPITNAEFHRNKRWVLRVDLKDFFPSINFGRVRGLFRAYPFECPPDVATVLAQVCCVHNELPQGAPTSPIISNYICWGLDAEVARLAASQHCHYTRYADDLTFSSGRRTFPRGLAAFDGDTAHVGKSLRDLIEKNGFRVNDDKTRLMPRAQRQRVTGLVVNSGVNVPREYIRSLRNLLHIWNAYGEEAAVAAFEAHEPARNWPPGKSPPEFALVIRGRVQHVGAVRGRGDPVYLKLARQLSEADPRFVAPAVAAGPVPARAVTVLAEGATDWLHLQAAQSYFHHRNEFTEFTLITDAEYNPVGENQLKKRLEALALTDQPRPVLGVFDADTDYSSALAQEGHRHLGRGVVALALAPPSWRRAADALCIEMLYPPKVLEAPDASGRRVYLREEFDDTTAIHVSGECVARDLRNTLVCETVFAVPGGASLARGKMSFAQSIANGEPPYDDIDFEGFRPTFERARLALSELKPRTATTEPSS